MEITGIRWEPPGFALTDIYIPLYADLTECLQGLGWKVQGFQDHNSSWSRVYNILVDDRCEKFLEWRLANT
mgnify:CR=1 FL=1